MKRLLAILFFASVCLAQSSISGTVSISGTAALGASGGGSTFPTPSFVQRTNPGGNGWANISGSTTSQTVTLDVTPTAGNQIVVLGYCGGTNTTLSIDAQETWTHVITNQATTSPGHWDMWIAYSASGTHNGFVVTAAATCTWMYTTAAEFSNVANSGFDQGPADAVGLTSGTITQSSNAALLVGVLTGGDGGTAPSAGTGYTIWANTNTGAFNPGVEYQIVTSSGSYSASFTGATGTVHTSIVTFK